MLGEKSFFHPYLQVMNEADLVSHWPEAELESFSDAEITKAAQVYSSEVAQEWEHLEKIYKRYP